MPITAAISKIVVFPNHIKKFMSAIRPLAPTTDDKNLIGLLIKPIDCKNELIGPMSENNAKNNIEKALAIIRLGI